MGIEIDTDQYPLLRPKYLFFGVIFYVLSIVIFQPSKQQSKRDNKNKSKKVRNKIGTVEIIIFFHNLLLAIFSGITFINTAPIAFNWFMEKGFNSGVCSFPLLYEHNVSSLGYWSYLFYLSKFYEFIDTWIIIARGRRPSWLQEYHHIGIVIGMFIICITKSFGGAIVTIENSFIHTLMYTYYALNIIGLKHLFPIKKSTLTMMQLIQFVIGCSLTSYALWTLSDCLSIGEKICGAYFLTYTGYIIFLFAQFYVRTYIIKGNNKNKSVSKKQE